MMLCYSVWESIISVHYMVMRKSTGKWYCREPSGLAAVTQQMVHSTLLACVLSRGGGQGLVPREKFQVMW